MAEDLISVLGKGSDLSLDGTPRRGSGVRAAFSDFVSPETLASNRQACTGQLPGFPARGVAHELRDSQFVPLSSFVVPA